MQGEESSDKSSDSVIPYGSLFASFASLHVLLKIIRQETSYKIDNIVLTTNQHFDKK